MSPLARSGSRQHHIQRLGSDSYQISWALEVKHGRILFYRRFTAAIGCGKGGATALKGCWQSTS